MMYGSGKDICSSLRGFVVLRVLFAKGCLGVQSLDVFSILNASGKCDMLWWLSSSRLQFNVRV